MPEIIKKFKSFWLIELLLFAAGFYLIYDGFVADGSTYNAEETAASQAAAKSNSSNVAAPAGMSKTILETVVVCLDVDAQKKKPLIAKGRFSRYIDMLYCFTEISGAIPDYLIHDWVHEGGQTYRQRIKMGNDTKVWSNMEMSPDKDGTWRVDVYTGDGQFLDSAHFVLK